MANAAPRRAARRRLQTLSRAPHLRGRRRRQRRHRRPAAEYVRRADSPGAGRGAAAGATWIFRGAWRRRGRDVELPARPARVVFFAATTCCLLLAALRDAPNADRDLRARVDAVLFPDAAALDAWRAGKAVDEDGAVVVEDGEELSAALVPTFADRASFYAATLPCRGGVESAPGRRGVPRLGPR